MMIYNIMLKVITKKNRQECIAMKMKKKNN